MVPDHHNTNCAYLESLEAVERDALGVALVYEDMNDEKYTFGYPCRLVYGFDIHGRGHGADGNDAPGV